MSRYPTPREFDPRQPVEVRVRFRWAGRDYSPGETFEWRRMGISMRRVRQMYESGKLKPASTDSKPVIEDETPSIDPDPVTEPSSDENFDFSDGLDEIYSLKDLREIAEMEGAPTKRSIKEQRDAIRENRADG